MVTGAAANSGALTAHSTPHLFATPSLRCGHRGLVKFAPARTVVPWDVGPTTTSPGTTVRGGEKQMRLRGGALGSGGMANGDGGLRLTDQANAALQAAVDNARGRGNLEAQIRKSTRLTLFSRYTRALTFENLCQGHSDAPLPGAA